MADTAPKAPGWWKLTTATGIGMFLALVLTLAAVAGVHYVLQYPPARDWRQSARATFFPRSAGDPAAARPIIEVPEKAFPRPDFTVRVPEDALPRAEVTVNAGGGTAAADRHRIPIYYRTTTLSGTMHRIQLINPHTTIKGLISYKTKDDVLAVTDRTYIAGRVTGPVTGDTPDAPVTRLKTEDGMMVCNNCTFEKIERP